MQRFINLILLKFCPTSSVSGELYRNNNNNSQVVFYSGPEMDDGQSVLCFVVQAFVASEVLGSAMRMIQKNVEKCNL